MKLSVVIMAGGSGKRFWPLSRESKAKQSLSLFSEKTLLAETIERIMPLAEEITIVSSLKQRAEIERDAEKYEKVKVIYEPCGRNTAPCILLSLLAIKSKCCEDRAVLVLPSDHYVAKPEKFRKTAENGLEFLDKHKNYIGTIGIEPAYPETGFGYIETGFSESDLLKRSHVWKRLKNSSKAETTSGTAGFSFFRLIRCLKSSKNLRPIFMKL